MIECENIEKQLQEEIKDIEQKTLEAYHHGGQNAHEYALSIGKHDLATFTAEEWETFCECMCKNYHLKYIELNV